MPFLSPDLCPGCNKLDPATQSYLIQPVGRGALGDEGADQDVGIKDDPLAPH